MLFESSRVGWVRAAWHGRIERGIFATWRSIEAKVAPTESGSTVLSVEQCVNGTGGCAQEFLLRHDDGHWFPVWQVWADSLPHGYAAQLWKGADRPGNAPRRSRPLQ